MIFQGLLDLPWYALVLITLGLTHVTIAAVTIYLHRNQAHRGVDLHPAVSHFFRLWLWLTTGMNTKEWAAVHRKHHAKVETEEDPHSPQMVGILTVLFKGAGLYHEEASKDETLEKYGFGTPDDWMENKVYRRFQNYGIILMLLANLAMFGIVPGLLVWLVQMVWIPFWAAGVINGVGHWFGYRNFQSADESRNIVPVGLIIGGEELHNNHHAYPTSSKLSARWWEFDVGWLYIRLLEKAGLARVKRVAPKVLSTDKPMCDLDTLNSVVTNRFHVLTRYADAMRRTCVDEMRDFARRSGRKVHLNNKALTRWLASRESWLSEHEHRGLKELLANSAVLKRIGDMRAELVSLWEDKEATKEQLVERMREWCRRAEESNIEPLRRFARELRGFSSLPGHVAAA